MYLRFYSLVHTHDRLQESQTSRSITPSPNSRQKQTIGRPQALAVQRARGLVQQAVTVQNPNILHPLNYRGQLLPTSRQASSNTSEGGANRESSLDDSGVVDDHDEQDIEYASIPIVDVSPSCLRLFSLCFRNWTARYSY